MSSSTPQLGDAVRPDGTLKDASEIDWSFDPDDLIPFPLDHPSGSHAGSSGGHTPAIVVASVRWTTRRSRPSQRVLDELEAAEATALASSASGVNHKHKATRALPNHRSRKTVINVVSDDDSDDESDSGTPSPPPTEPASDDYESLQAMADADNQVCSLSRGTVSFSLISSRTRPLDPRLRVQQTYGSFSYFKKSTSIRTPGRL